MTMHIIPADGDRRLYRALCGALVTHLHYGGTDCEACTLLDIGDAIGLVPVSADEVRMRTVQVTRAGGGVDVFTGATMVVGEEDVLHVLSIPDAIVREKYAHDEWRHADLYQGPELVHRAVNPR